MITRSICIAVCSLSLLITLNGCSQDSKKAPPPSNSRPNSNDNTKKPTPSKSPEVSQSPVAQATPTVAASPKPPAVPPVPLPGLAAGGSGVGKAPEIPASITGATIASCNDQGRSWLPAAPATGGLVGSCGEPLAQFSCDPETLRGYFKASGQAAVFDDFVARHPGYSLYNCGYQAPILKAHWAAVVNGKLRYASQDLTWSKTGSPIK